jgi:predicted RNase H-like nuclease
MSASSRDVGSVVGIDGYKAGWVAVALSAGEWSWATAPVEGIHALIRSDAVVGIDMPIGLLESGERDCDGLARANLPGAASRVFTTPPRAVLELGPQPNATAQELSRQLMGKGISRQALALAPRILALDDCLRGATPGEVIEVHPELSFAEMTGSGPLASKKSARGVGQRLAALEEYFPTVTTILAAAPTDVPIDDALDALAALWSAQRWRAGIARTLPAGAKEAPFMAI